MSKTPPTVVLTGASGYVGRLIVDELARVSTELRCLTRTPSKITSILPQNATAVKADILDANSLISALEGADVAYYLVHSMGEADDFEQIETRAARNFAAAAKNVGLKRIIYLGGLFQGSSQEVFSPHMASRHRVGEILRESGVPVTEFRASVVIGAGSMPFEAVRALVQRLPIMITPRWVREHLQPIAASDLKRYLISALHDDEGNHVYEIGGADVVRYQDLMNLYAKARGLRRWMFPVPLITPRLSSHWLRLVTPAHYELGKRIVESAVHSSVVKDRAADKFGIKVMDTKSAIQEALTTERREMKFLEPTSMDDLAGTGVIRSMRGTRFVEQRWFQTDADQQDGAELIRSIGGRNGYFWGNRLWRLRGWIDRVIGGAGLRGRSNDADPVVGDQIDFWNVVTAEENRLTLKAEMKLPGEAILDMRIMPVTEFGDEQKNRVVHTVSFDPRGLIGMAYWYALFPVHSLVFRNMVNQMSRRLCRATEGI
jgi:uncharacterized protein YbjT (DUF2867 family)